MDISNITSKQAEKDSKRKATEKSNKNQHKSKYMRSENAQQARQAYSRHDNRIHVCPDEVVEDVPPHYLKELKRILRNKSERIGQ